MSSPLVVYELCIIIILVPAVSVSCDCLPRNPLNSVTIKCRNTLQQSLLGSESVQDSGAEWLEYVDPNEPRYCLCNQVWVYHCLRLRVIVCLIRICWSPEIKQAENHSTR